MGRPNSISPVPRSDVSSTETEAEFEWPFGRIDYLHRSDLRETAYEIFFTSCRSSPGFGGGGSARTNTSSLTYPYLEDGAGSPRSPGPRGGIGSPRSPGPRGGTMMVVNSKIKKSLGLKSRRMSMMRMMNQTGATKVPSSPGRVKRPMTSSEIMRQQMRVTEQSDNRLRKTLMRSLVGQVCTFFPSPKHIQEIRCILVEFSLLKCIESLK